MSVYHFGSSTVLAQCLEPGVVTCLVQTFPPSHPSSGLGQIKYHVMFAVIVSFACSGFRARCYFLVVFSLQRFARLKRDPARASHLPNHPPATAPGTHFTIATAGYCCWVVLRFMLYLTLLLHHFPYHCAVLNLFNRVDIFVFFFLFSTAMMWSCFV